MAKGFHWVVALLILGLLAVGFCMEDLAPDPFKFQIYGIHKALGIAVLALAAARLVWRIVNIVPASPPHHKTWEKILSRCADYALYALMFAMPLSGWAMSSAGGHPVGFFGLFELPPLVGKDPDLGKAMNALHGTLAWALIGVLSLHAAGALKHHFIDRDDTLRRMLLHCGKSCAIREKP